MIMLAEKDRYSAGRKASFISLLINILLSTIKISAGFAFASKALIADGLHSVSDMASTIVILISIKVSQSPADKRHPYGHGKAEQIGTTILGFILLFTGLMLIEDTVVNIFSGKIAIPGEITLWVAVLSIFTKEGLYQYTVKIGKKINSKGLIADAHHHRSDALSSIAALIGITGARLGYPIFDPLAGLLVAVFIVKIGIGILNESINELMDGTPDQEKIAEYREIARTVQGVKGVGQIKLRSYGSKVIIDLDVAVEQELSVIEGHRVATDVSDKLREMDANVKDVLVHVDPWQDKEKQLNISKGE